MRAMLKIKRHDKTRYVIVASAMVVVSFIVIAQLRHNSRASNNGRINSSNTQEETPANSDSEGDTGQRNNQKGTTPNADYTPPEGNSGITIAPSVSGNNVVVSTQLAGYSDGTCKLTATNGAKTNSQTADVIYAPSFSTCAGFVVPIDDLGHGTWNLTLDVTSGGITSTKTTTYEVR